MLERDTFHVIRLESSQHGAAIVTVSHEVAAGAQNLGSFTDPGAAIDFAQKEAQRLNASGVTAQYVDPPDDLVGTG